MSHKHNTATRLYQRVFAVEQLASWLLDQSGNRKAAHLIKDCHTVSQNCNRLSIAQERLKQYGTNITLPVERCRVDVVALERRVQDLADMYVFDDNLRVGKPTGEVREDGAVRMVVYIPEDQRPDAVRCRNCRKNIDGLHPTETFWWDETQAWYCDSCAHNTDVIPFNETDEFRLAWYGEHKARR